MVIGNKLILLRDFKEKDIKTRLYWETTENEWQLWNGPWEYEGRSEEQIKEDMKKYILKLNNKVETYKNIEDSDLRHEFQIDVNDETHEYIGWCSCYNMNENFEITKGKGKCAIGICIVPLTVRRKGYATAALTEFISYLKQNGTDEIYTQTWSGNLRMIKLAEKLGFEECLRKKDIRLVRGKKYDGLTFKLNDMKFNKFLKSIGC